MRASRESVNIRIAQIISERGTCRRLKVGAVITKNNKIISTGYNGPPAGSTHCNEIICNTESPCKRALHAEENALISSNLDWYDGNINRDKNLILYCTHQPCLECAKKIVKYSIGVVYYINEYRDEAGLKYLLKHKVLTINIDEQGNTK